MCMLLSINASLILKSSIFVFQELDLFALAVHWLQAEILQFLMYEILRVLISLVCEECIGQARLFHFWMGVRPFSKLTISNSFFF